MADGHCLCPLAVSQLSKPAWFECRFCVSAIGLDDGNPLVASSKGSAGGLPRLDPSAKFEAVAPGLCPGRIGGFCCPSALAQPTDIRAMEVQIARVMRLSD